jgi:hypothetical protein
MSYNLTENQKGLARWIVQQVRDGKLQEDFLVIWTQPEIGGPGSELAHGIIAECPGHPEITSGLLDALAQAGLLLCKPNHQGTTEQFVKTVYGGPTTTHREYEINRTCTLRARAYEAVDSDFEPLPAQFDTQVTIGAIIHTMSGGTVQAVGIAQDADISQIINDPDLLRSQVEALTGNLLDAVKSSLRVNELADYAQAVRDLKEQLLKEKPNPSVIQPLARTIGLLGDIEGTISLITRVWTFLHPLLLIAAAKLG